MLVGRIFSRRARLTSCPILWQAGTGVGVAVWVQDGSCAEPEGQFLQGMASPATLVEIKAGLLLMEWAYKEKMQGICIKTDCSVFVQGALAKS
ncbi:hypothetical protein RHGRI_001030 [Rhododendron griersonianum]|uniref:RNase H type-1 domain-containing protein n=1 Tax=Rhododendron griersonianum TaxID=479676 RepID=A0AAV6LIR3_9ERIC|nr:hypothetical protein RHGRI_001030 [Rhododendron griersonianum]